MTLVEYDEDLVCDLMQEVFVQEFFWRFLNYFTQY